MKNIYFLVLMAVIVAPSLRAAVTFNMSAAGLYDSSGSPAPQAGLVLLVADTAVDGFSSLADGASLTLNSFLNGTDDQVLARWSLGASSGTDGQFSDSVSNLNLSGNWGVNDPLALLWFPTLTTASSSASSGDTYGLYYNLASASDPSLDGGDQWITPASGTKALNFFTTGFGGSHSESTGNASFTVSGGAGVPEPSRGLLGMIGLGVLALRRRRR